MSNWMDFHSQSVSLEEIYFCQFWFLLLAKDFVFQINSNCIDYLCEILRHSWTTLNQSCEKILTGEENNAHLDRATVTVRSSTYMACFALELLRAYIHIVTISFDE